MKTFGTREECKEKLEEVCNFAIENDLSVAIVFKKAPIVGGIEYRLVYAENYQECKVWLESVITFLDNLSIPLPYAAYINGSFEKSKGDLFI